MSDIHYIFFSLDLSVSYPTSSCSHLHHCTYTSKSNIKPYTVWKQFILTVMFECYVKKYGRASGSSLITHRKTFHGIKVVLSSQSSGNDIYPKAKCPIFRVEASCSYGVIVEGTIPESGHLPQPLYTDRSPAHFCGFPFHSCCLDEFPTRIVHLVTSF